MAEQDNQPLSSARFVLQTQDPIQQSLIRVCLHCTNQSLELSKSLSNKIHRIHYQGRMLHVLLRIPPKLECWASLALIPYCHRVNSLPKFLPITGLVLNTSQPYNELKHQSIKLKRISIINIHTRYRKIPTFIYIRTISKGHSHYTNVAYCRTTQTTTWSREHSGCTQATLHVTRQSDLQHS